ncbi:2-phospho-L-lactate guanylyltransferase [Halorubrum sp. BV1]|uniref:2-phospho-L-lactate guanylyltransferase n=1 Tax=Halorubrum sp. BV1 TaxID=1498500 RepID=UPI000679C913|nr:2-phospho-L-lactate guanylyltransferase [Halorubrum sp. BV1]
MEVLVPFSTDRPKSRLSAILDSAERAAFARTMLADVLDTVVAAGGDPRVLATGPIDPAIDCPVEIDDRPLTRAVNAALSDRRAAADRPVGIVMADLAIATPSALGDLFDAVERSVDVSIAPGRGGGTNALAVDHDEFRVDYHGASYRDHRRIADEVDATVGVIDSHRLATDIDEPADLAEVLIHGDGAAAAWLRDAGIDLADDGGRVGVARVEDGNDASIRDRDPF